MSNNKDSNKAAADKPGDTPEQLRCVLLSVGGAELLVPNAVLAEVSNFVPPEPFEDAPDWLLGTVEWNRWSVPVIAYGRLVRTDTEEAPAAKSRIVITKSLQHSERMPYLGILVSGAPKVVDARVDSLEAEDSDNRMIGLLAEVSVRKKKALVPDLDRLAQLVAHAAFGAVPVTQMRDS